MLDQQRVLEILSKLNWTNGYDRDRLNQALLQQNLAVPQEFINSLPPFEVFATAEEMLHSVPDVVWNIHADRESRARGHIEVAPPEPRQRTVGRTT